MRPSPRRRAAEILLAWEAEGPGRRPPLERLLERETAGAAWDPRDRALCRELVLGVVRWRSRIDAAVDRCLHGPARRLSPRVRQHLRVAAYQVLFLDRVPDRAAVHEAVAAVKAGPERRAAGLVNAVLRRLAREGEGPPHAGADPVERLARETAHPAWMVRRWAGRLGLEAAAALCRTNNTRAPLTLRANTRRLSRSVLLDRLQDAGIEAVPGGLAPEAVVLPGWRGDPAEIPGLAEGLCLVQDEAAQLVSHCLAPAPGEAVLDACAGVGGKTTHIAALMDDRGRVAAADPDAGRLGRLAENARRLGLRAVEILPPGDFRRLRAAGRPAFDRILVDAPCSGLGVIRRHPDIKWNRTPADVPRLAALQLDLLRGAAPLLRPGGRLAYATCTLEPEETSGVVRAFLEAAPGWRLVPVAAALPPAARRFVTPDGCLEIRPEPGGPDGFFAAVMEAPA
ncbi:16S rRNA (cytosine(967)-C(5))-methyltransferase RsmB [Dissulfurirhabdus thermomarina]|uniref:16S rRNA (cytosine(967)-C(5))-methyltransferase n=1 Tax=Dissulfurirhabdus thermomarina TaxID=1765737 RepID=A0A6N9TL57_DISTH|nr:16S rRNA (cytosine(967)-C(5))-methyltransferase RsmB [Dissulfurirhabdus thermomarina]NDY42001.1 16S rRNA (cytosine(967)-C(5))-methyltransferase RsmB [Dissulfurirhabdus thermomarina]NMX24014.1 16S rRNA (cytosine(967)-C(5))-methyltransferase RsmB [Dissulfurirhabdus thermomarina]